MPFLFWPLVGLAGGVGFVLGTVSYVARHPPPIRVRGSGYLEPERVLAARRAREALHRELMKVPSPALPDVVEELIRKEQLLTLEFDQLQELFEAAWGSRKPDYRKVLQHSYTYVTYRCNDVLTGFANVAWDGGVHFFLLDVTVHPEWRRRGIARRMVQEAIELCRGKGEWLHVDTSSPELMDGLYLPAGFQATPAGVIALKPFK